MGDITLGQIQNVLTFIVSFCGIIGAIWVAVQKAVAKAFQPIEKKIDKVDLNATKNFLVRSISDIDRGNKLDGVNRLRFLEQYEHYEKELNGNSYIKEEVERLKKEGKL